MYVNQRTTHIRTHTCSNENSNQGGEEAGGGEDVFGLAAASRANSVGCPRQRWNGDLALV